MEEIRQQLKDFCDCLPEHYSKTLFERAVDEMIHLVSIMTCWTQDPCDTFLNSARTEYMDVEKFDPCSCAGGIAEFEPYYVPIEPDSFAVTLIERDGINVIETPIPASSTNYYDGKLLIDLRGYAVFGDCGCQREYKLKIEYFAGYELLPDCLLQLFCDLLHVIMDKNKCDCSACQACKNHEDVEIHFDDDVRPTVEKYLKALVLSGYEQQLGLISLCGRKSSDIWGVVV